MQSHPVLPTLHLPKPSTFCKRRLGSMRCGAQYLGFTRQRRRRSSHGTLNNYILIICRWSDTKKWVKFSNFRIALVTCSWQEASTELTRFPRCFSGTAGTKYEWKGASWSSRCCEKWLQNWPCGTASQFVLGLLTTAWTVLARNSSGPDALRCYWVLSVKGVHFSCVQIYSQ